EKTSKVITWIQKARDDLLKQLKDLEQQYLDFKTNASVGDNEGKSEAFNPARVEEWNRTASHAMLRAFELQTKIELAQKLIAQGAGIGTINQSLEKVEGLSADSGRNAARPAADSDVMGGGPTVTSEQVSSELATVKLKRKMTERLIHHLRNEQDAVA